MPNKISKRASKANVDKHKDMNPAEMSFDVAEWLEGERAEHERRMQQLGCFQETTEESREDHLKSRRE
jgi:hypothetical protein